MCKSQPQEWERRPRGTRGNPDDSNGILRSQFGRSNKERVKKVGEGSDRDCWFPVVLRNLAQSSIPVEEPSPRRCSKEHLAGIRERGTVAPMT